MWIVYPRNTRKNALPISLNNENEKLTDKVSDMHNVRQNNYNLSLKVISYKLLANIACFNPFYVMVYIHRQGLITNANNLPLKELEHRKLGWKVFILIYDLGKSLSKEMW